MFSPPRVCWCGGDAGFLITVGHSFCHFQQNCGVSFTPAWLRAAPGQPSSGHGEEVLALLWLNASSIASGFFSSTWWLRQLAVSGPVKPTNPLPNSPRGQVTTSNVDGPRRCVANSKWMHQGARGSVLSLSSALASCLAKGQEHVGMGTGGERRRREYSFTQVQAGPLMGEGAACGPPGKL